MMLKLFFVVLCAVLSVSAITKLPNIIRPCKLDNYRCIRDNFAANSRCNPRVRGAAPAVYTVPRARFETPFFNASYVDNNLVVRGQDRCFVSEYFVNRETDGGVLGIDCPWLSFQSDRTLYQHFSLREDKVFSFKINGSYPLLRLTTTLANANRLNICNEFTLVEVTALPVFDLNPNDRPTDDFLTKNLDLLNIYEIETFFHRADMLARTFINNALCDFGC